jgi:hypothetical protein
MADAALLDQLILNAVGPAWTKLAMVLARAANQPDLDFDNHTDQFAVLADRVGALVEAGALIARGDIREWRCSEVRKA